LPVLSARIGTVGTPVATFSGKFFWKKHGPAIPSGHRSAVNGRSASHGRMSGEIRS
jgi:hypothetical protein